MPKYRIHGTISVIWRSCIPIDVMVEADSEDRAYMLAADDVDYNPDNADYEDEEWCNVNAEVLEETGVVEPKCTKTIELFN